MNYNGYMGKDTLRSLINKDHLGRALVGLGRTSNPEAWEVQDEPMKDGRPVWEHMIKHVHAWSKEFGVIENAGVVMGAAHAHPQNSEAVYSWHLSRAREIVGNDLWFLIPGIGKQKGFTRETVLAAYRGLGSIAINSSSEIDFASSGPDFAEAAARATEKLCDEINQYR